MAIKGLAYDVVEWPPPLQAPMQRVIFGARTVPGLKIDGEKVSGSRAIIRRLEQLAPEPPLFPLNAQVRGRIEDAERWGDEIFQATARKLSGSGSSTAQRRWSATASTPSCGYQRRGQIECAGDCWS